MDVAQERIQSMGSNGVLRLDELWLEDDTNQEWRLEAK